ncbi:MAG: hypothetical protein OXH61_09375 [Acidimicrobiaceae bacterium]|nr:hypothetical protein [Acidimicrobiaceae bacterium]
MTAQPHVLRLGVEYRWQNLSLESQVHQRLDRDRRAIRESGVDQLLIDHVEIGDDQQVRALRLISARFADHLGQRVGHPLLGRATRLRVFLLP